MNRPDTLVAVASWLAAGHHWLTDVLVAWTLGLAWLTVVVVAQRLFLTVHRRRCLTRGA